MFKQFLIATFCLTAAVAGSTSADAALTTSPYLFTEQAATSTGHFEWDEFSNPATGPHAPDVASTGTGDAELSLSTGFVTGTQNIYSLGSAVDYSIDLQNLEASTANTTLVLQLSATDSITPRTILLDGLAPNTLVDRSVAAGVLHNTDNGTGGAPFDTHYYWAEWQVAAQTAYTIAYSTPEGHVSLAQARVDYFNSATPYGAVAAANVPEPTTLGLLLLGGAASFVAGRRR